MDRALRGAVLAALDRMPHKKPPSRRLGRTGGTAPSVSDEQLAQSDHGKLFTEDGLKAQDTERVGAMAPDTDPPDSGPRTYPASARPTVRRPQRPVR